jgi:hypothetical protein
MLILVNGQSEAWKEVDAGWHAAFNEFQWIKLDMEKPTL